MANQKNILLQISRDNQIYDLFVKTTAHNVVVDKATGETLKQRLAKIAKQLGSTDLSVTEQINQVKDDLAYMLENADPEALDSIKEISEWIGKNGQDFENLTLLTKGLEALLKEYADKVAEQALTDAKAYADEVSAQALEDAKAYTDEEVAKEAEAREAKDKELDQKIEDLIVVFENADEYDPEKVKKFACIFLDDDPIEAASEKDLVDAAAQTENKNVVLTANISVANSIDLSGLNIESDGYEIVAASQDVVITL